MGVGRIEDGRAGTFPRQAVLADILQFRHALVALGVDSADLVIGIPIVRYEVRISDGTRGAGVSGEVGIFDMGVRRIDADHVGVGATDPVDDLETLDNAAVACLGRGCHVGGSCEFHLAAAFVFKRGVAAGEDHRRKERQNHKEIETVLHGLIFPGVIKSGALEIIRIDILAHRNDSRIFNDGACKQGLAGFSIHFVNDIKNYLL